MTKTRLIKLRAAPRGPAPSPQNSDYREGLITFLVSYTGH
jgi:hypothetical protein